MKILVVDDNRDSTEALVRLLRVMGHASRGECDSTLALAAAHDFQADVVILDLGMPGLEGLSLARELRSDLKTTHMRLIAVTGYAYPRHREASRAAGIDVHLAKPVEIEDLRRALAVHDSRLAN